MFQIKLQVMQDLFDSQTQSSRQALALARRIFWDSYFKTRDFEAQWKHAGTTESFLMDHSTLLDLGQGIQTSLGGGFGGY